MLKVAGERVSACIYYTTRADGYEEKDGTRG